MKLQAIAGLIAAAGLSERMGSFKPLHDFEGESFITAITRKLIPRCNKVIVVTGFKEEEIKTVINNSFKEKNVSIVSNPDFREGMFTSLQAGLKEAFDCDWILYHFVDQPFFSEKFYSDFLSQTNTDADWIQPSYDRKLGHPLLFNRKVAELIINSPVGSNLRIIKENKMIIKSAWECGYPEVRIDFDSEENIKEYYKLKSATNRG